MNVFESSCKINQRELSPDGRLEYRKNHAAIILQMAVTSPTTVQVVKAQADDDEQALKWILEALMAVGRSCENILAQRQGSANLSSPEIRKINESHGTNFKNWPKFFEDSGPEGRVVRITQ